MKQNYCTLYIVRHGQTDWNEKNLVQGHADTKLTEKGKLQAKTIATELQHIHFDAVFSSDLSRAKRTAEIIALEKKLAIETTQLLRERDYGHFVGQSRESLKTLHELYNAVKDEERFSYKPFPDVESEEELVGRFITFLREISVMYAGKTVLVVCHGGVMKSFLTHIGFFKSRPSENMIANTGYMKLRTDGVDFFLEDTNGIKSE